MYIWYTAAWRKLTIWASYDRLNLEPVQWDSWEPEGPSFAKRKYFHFYKHLLKKFSVEISGERTFYKNRFNMNSGLI